MSAGSRKMPPPIVTLTMLAARAKVPMERRREDSADEVRVGSVTVRDANTGQRQASVQDRAGPIPAKLPQNAPGLRDLSGSTLLDIAPDLLEIAAERASSPPGERDDEDD